MSHREPKTVVFEEPEIQKQMLEEFKTKKSVVLEAPETEKSAVLKEPETPEQILMRMFSKAESFNTAIDKWFLLNK